MGRRTGDAIISLFQLQQRRWHPEACSYWNGTPTLIVEKQRQQRAGIYWIQRNGTRTELIALGASIRLNWLSELREAKKVNEESFQMLQLAHAEGYCNVAQVFSNYLTKRG